MLRVTAIALLTVITAFAVTVKDESGINRAEITDSAFFPVGNAIALSDDLDAEMYNTPWPDGSKVLFSDPRDASHIDICTVPTTGTKVKTTISPGSNTYEYPDVNSTGTYVCYVTGDDNDDFWEVAVMTVPGGVETIITNNEATYDLDSHFPRFSGTGGKIAHVQRDWDTNTDRIVTTDIDGSDEAIICTLPSGITNRIESMDWLGITNYIIYTDRSSDLYKVTASAGSTPIRIGTFSNYHRAQSNADGTKIVAAETWNATRQRYVTLNPDGSGRTTIVRPDYFPVFDEIYCQVCFTAGGDGVISLATLASNPSFFDIFLIDESEYCGIESVSLGTLKAAFK